ncbi:putative signal peptide protein, partial [Puccinia sorghi]
TQVPVVKRLYMWNFLMLAVGDLLGLEQVLNDSYKFVEVHERREDLKLAAKNKQARIDVIQEKRKLQLEARRMRVIKMKAQVKVRCAKMDEVNFSFYGGASRELHGFQQF